MAEYMREDESLIRHVFPPEMMEEREKQLILALSDCAGAYYDMDFTHDRILGTAIQTVDGIEHSINARIGLPDNCAYTEIVKYWGNRLAVEEQPAFFAYFDIRQVREAYARGQRLLQYRCHARNLDGDPVLVVLKIRLYENKSTGDLLGLGYVADMWDMEAARQKEEQMQAQYQEAEGRASFLEAMAGNLPGGYHRCSVNGGFVLEYVSDSFLDIVGYTRQQLAEEQNNQFINIVAPEDREFFMSHEPALVRDGQIHVAYRIARRDGSRRWVQDSTQYVEKDGLEYYQCTLADITDFVNHQEELARRNLELAKEKSLLEIMEQNMPSGYHRCKAEAGCPFVHISKNFCEILGFSKEEIEQDFDNLYSNLIWEEDAHMIRTYHDMLTMRGKGNVSDTSVYRVKHKDGTFRWITDSTMFVDLGEDSFFQGTISDITSHVEALNEARERAEAANQAKSTFLFNASHDIRTPMNAIQGFARILEDNADDPVMVRDTVRKIRQAGDTLMTLMNDILELARIERGKETVEQQPLDMSGHVQKLHEMFAGEMEEAGLTFRMENELSHPHVLADDLKLTRIAMNLLSNAKKFTPAGGTVTFGVKETGYDGSQARYGLFVRDTGIGMSREFQARAFEQFERERTSTNSGQSGSGLGLAIIKRLVDLMGGTCVIDSCPGKGTEILVTVPLALDTGYSLADSAKKSRSADLKDKRILLVEDNPFNREIARYVLEGMKCQVEEAENGAVCLEKLEEMPAAWYDLILMDIQMPVMDGYAATRAVRNLSDRAKANIPIIAMTANAFEEDRKRCMELGMNDHVGKPIDPDGLMETLVRLI